MQDLFSSTWLLSENSRPASTCSTHEPQLPVAVAHTLSIFCFSCRSSALLQQKHRCTKPLLSLITARVEHELSKFVTSLINAGFTLWQSFYFVQWNWIVKLCNAVCTQHKMSSRFWLLTKRNSLWLASELSTLSFCLLAAIAWTTLSLRSALSLCLAFAAFASFNLEPNGRNVVVCLFCCYFF